MYCIETKLQKKDRTKKSNSYKCIHLLNIVSEIYKVQGGVDSSDILVDDNADILGT